MAKIVRIRKAFSNKASTVIEVLFDTLPILDPYVTDPLIWEPVLNWYLDGFPRAQELVREEFKVWSHRNPQDGILETNYKALKGCSIATSVWFRLKWVSRSYRWQSQPLPFFAVRQFPHAHGKTFWVDSLEPIYFVVPHLPANPGTEDYEDLYAEILTDTIVIPPTNSVYTRYYEHYEEFFVKTLRASFNPEPLNNFTMKKDSYHMFGDTPTPEQGEYRPFPEDLEAIFAGVVDEPDRRARWLVFADALEETFPDAEANANFIRLLNAPTPTYPLPNLPRTA